MMTWISGQARQREVQGRLKLLHANSRSTQVGVIRRDQWSIEAEALETDVEKTLAPLRVQDLVYTWSKDYRQLRIRSAQTCSRQLIWWTQLWVKCWDQIKSTSQDLRQFQCVSSSISRNSHRHYSSKRALEETREIDRLTPTLRCSSNTHL